MQTRRPLQRYTDGEGFKVFLYCESFYGGDLRARSQFHEALELDLARPTRFVLERVGAWLRMTEAERAALTQTPILHDRAPRME